MSPQPSLIWFNGKIVKSEEANVNIMTHAIHYGTGIFEGIRCYDTEQGPAIFRLDDHIRRFFQSAKIYRMNLGYTEEELKDAIKETIRRNQIRECYIRPLAYFANVQLGIHPREVKIGVAIMLTELKLYLGTGKVGIRAKLSPWSKIDNAALPSMAKGTGQYLSSYLSSHDARMDGYDEAILLDKNGFVAEGPGENIFMVKDGKVYTPSLESPILAGLTRDTIIKLLEKENPVIEKRIGISELLTSDEAFFAGTAAEITPINEISGYEMKSSEEGSVSMDLRARYFNLVRGRDKNYSHWLTIP
ncbi:MAG: branched-chain amino acid transaminase [Candidatus Thermoplasmatota archaeon]|jgi:branched-chain amino acid aminotransferase|nr:branched-chain amino acid transaminase [Candidatus Thermoplasmatota archaeon]MCL5793919.1 branched-chain amino acid transaminase [Candidatus Thermoplasmatota archaeon]